MFIAIEGIDASGKATQSKLLAAKLAAKLFSFPDYNTPMGRLIEGHLKRYWCAMPDRGTPGGVHRNTDILNAYVFQALQVTNRMEHAMAIYECMEEGQHVVADRYWPSGWVYGQTDGLDPEWLMRIQENLPGPDLHLLLDIAPGQSGERRPERRDRYEEEEGLMDKAAHLYRQLWRAQAADSDDWVVINGRDTIEGVHRQIIKAIDEYAARIIYPQLTLPWAVP